MKGLLDQVDRITEELMKFPFQILLYGAGMAGNIAAVKCWERFPDRTYINLGSALDPLFNAHQTRSQQLSHADARELFKELL